MRFYLCKYMYGDVIVKFSSAFAARGHTNHIAKRRSTLTYIYIVHNISESFCTIFVPMFFLFEIQNFQQNVLQLYQKSYCIQIFLTEFHKLANLYNIEKNKKRQPKAKI